MGCCDESEGSKLALAPCGCIFVFLVSGNIIVGNSAIVHSYMLTLSPRRMAKVLGGWIPFLLQEDDFQSVAGDDTKTKMRPRGTTVANCLHAHPFDREIRIVT